jgi:hypothetical protein
VIDLSARLMHTEKSVDAGYDDSHSSGMFIRRLGPNPHENGRKTENLAGCPDILELADGDFAVIGRDLTAEAQHEMFPSASCGPDERVVRLPRRILIAAKGDIPDTI